MIAKVKSILRYIFTLPLKGVGFGSITVIMLLFSLITGLWLNYQFYLYSLVFTSFVMFPLLYPFRKYVSKIKPFWFYFDDEDGVYGAEYWRNNKGLKKNFITAFRWCAVRNPTWNLQAYLKPYKENAKLNILYSKGSLSQDGKIVSKYKDAKVHYEDTDGNWIGNTGTIVSTKYSVLGSMFLWFTADGVLFWRYSFAGKFIGNLGLEIQIGAFYRYKLKIKFKNFKFIK